MFLQINSTVENKKVEIYTNDYSGFLGGLQELNINKAFIIKMELYSDYIMVQVLNERPFNISTVGTDIYLQVDEVNSVAPESLLDLYTKLEELF